MFHLKPQKTGNLRKVLHVKVGARLMLTTNIDVSDGLTNGTVGTVKYVITEKNYLEGQGHFSGV